MNEDQNDQTARLEEENSRLNRELEGHLKSDPTLPSFDDDLVQLQAENLKLRELLLRYKALEADIAAEKIFQKAKKKLTTWLTVGGGVVTLVSLIGLLKVNEYARNLVDEKMKTLTEEKIDKTIQDEGQKEVAKFIERERGSFEDYGRQQVQQIVALMPIGKIPGTVASTSSFPQVTISYIDYTSRMNPVRNQETEGGVVGFAVAAAMEYQIAQKLGKSVILSPRQIYNLTRRAESTGGSDSGARIEDAIKVLSKVGAIPEEAWPYKAGDFAASEPSTAQTATHYKVKGSRPLSGLDEIRAALQYYGPVVAGITLYDSFMTPAVQKNGMVPMPSGGEQVVGGFAICIVGYDDSKRLLKFKNDWGPTWGEHGYGYLKYDYVNKNLFEGAWLLTL